jgi:hypothetical protein
MGAQVATRSVLLPSWKASAPASAAARDRPSARVKA